MLDPGENSDIAHWPLEAVFSRRLFQKPALDEMNISTRVDSEGKRAVASHNGPHDLARHDRPRRAPHRRRPADSVGLSATPVWRRVKELEASGVIRGYVALLDREKLGLSICVLAHVTLVRHSEGAVEQFEAMAKSSPEIMECHSTTGEGDYLIKVVAPDMKAYDRFLQDKVFKTPGVANVRSSVVLREVKYETALPVD
jgi:Lrp/AsnC family leucine-responsive transcriptional regulator